VRLPLDEARVFIKDHHPAYISWERFEANQAKIADNRARWSNGMGENRGAIRNGQALLVGLLRCGQCGRRLLVSYSGSTPVYYCHGGEGMRSARCLTVGAVGLDRAVGRELCRALQPLSVQASLDAEVLRARDHERLVEQERLRVQAAQYEADRGLEQYDEVDPKNRLVADTLEDRLNDRLGELKAAEERLAVAVAGCGPLSETDRTLLAELGEHFDTVWNHPETDVGLRKQLVRTAISEIALTLQTDQERVEAVIHWQGGVHTSCHVHKRVARRGAKANPELVETVRRLACGLDGGQIARVLNLNGCTTPRGLPWTLERVRHFRKHHRIRQAEQDANVLSANESARYLGISYSAVERLATLGVLDRNQVMPYAPWRVDREQLDSEPVRTAVSRLKATGRMTKRAGRSAGQLTLLPSDAAKV